MSRNKSASRGAVVCVVVCAVCIAVIVALRYFSPGAQDDAKQDEPASAPSATYQAGIAFDLVGQARDIDKDGNEVYDPWDFAKAWDWTGAMRFTVSRAVLYNSAQDAGFSLDADDETFYAGKRMVVVEIDIQNVNAVCRETTVQENGAPSFNLTMFALRTVDGQLLEPFCFNAPQIEGLTWDESKSASYTWVKEGSQATVRIGYPLINQDEELSLDNLQMVVQNGWYDGAPVVELGAAQVAGAPYVAD